MHRAGRVIVACCIAAVLSMTACGPATPAVTFSSGAESLDVAAVQRFALDADLSSAVSVEASGSPALRERLLQSLRGHGAEGGRAADLLTAGFPPVTAALPIVVRVGPVEGKKAVSVVEAIPGDSGKLTRRRLWVFDYETGSVIRATAFR
ncbi:MAG: hypothetical protein Q7W30_06990 [Coriobacteriia bacterium]|nr:hypothetical protein [Coriobacteriia bacterium]